MTPLIKEGKNVTIGAEVRTIVSSNKSMGENCVCKNEAFKPKNQLQNLIPYQKLSLSQHVKRRSAARTNVGTGPHNATTDG
jgi:hypothetical protein